MVDKESYTAASSLPAKILHKKVIDEKGRIIPMHIQLSPTNACNLNCDFCSCSDRDKKKELSLKEIKWILDVCAERGTEAITITGGGEPLMNKDLNEIIEYAKLKNIKVGLVTNGILLHKLEKHDNLIWCRISSSDDREPAFEPISYALDINPDTDWAFSHVITANPDYEIMHRLINFANEHDFTHVRLVSDLFDLENVPDMKLVEDNIEFDDSKVIYQGRKDSTKGAKDCFISLLKPIISPEGVFPCCGVQYAIHGQKRDMIERMKMGDIKDLPEILDKQKYFNGSICDVCYYNQYNDALSKLKNKPQHLEFV